MSEHSFDAKVEELVEARRFNRTLSPAVNRLLRTSDKEHAAYLEGDEDAQFRNRRQCQCYPKGFVMTPRAVKEQMKADHIRAGRHESWCPAFNHRRDYEPWYFGLMAPSYTEASARRDEDAERSDYSRGPGRFRQAD